MLQLVKTLRGKYGLQAPLACHSVALCKFSNVAVIWSRGNSGIQEHLAYHSVTLCRFSHVAAVLHYIPDSLNCGPIWCLLQQKDWEGLWHVLADSKLSSMKDHEVLSSSPWSCFFWLSLFIVCNGFWNMVVGCDEGHDSSRLWEVQPHSLVSFLF